MSKYIIKNCPAILKMTKVCDDYRTTRDNPELCKNINDCVIKQIVERCKKVREGTADICTNPYEYATYCETRGIFELLDIQEVE